MFSVEELTECGVKQKRIVNVANILVNLLILCYFKYFNFFISSLSVLVPYLKQDNLLLNLVLPVGISFYTFSALSYSIDVYRGKITPTKDFIQVALFIGFFPQLLAGPIARGSDMLPQYSRPRRFDYNFAVDGLRQILWGLFKKEVIAVNCGVLVDKVWMNYSSQSGSSLLLAGVLYSFQIYGDFSGYTDMAIGISKLFGIKLCDNFKVPYFSRDIAEFWCRWHISLTSWFRDYLYIPLGGSRCSRAKHIRNILIVFLVSGMWHGANWTYIIWGVYHGVLLVLLVLMGKTKRYKEGDSIVRQNGFFSSIKEITRLFVTFGLVTLGWIFLGPIA